MPGDRELGVCVITDHIAASFFAPLFQVPGMQPSPARRCTRVGEDDPRILKTSCLYCPMFKMGTSDSQNGNLVLKRRDTEPDLPFRQIDLHNAFWDVSEVFLENLADSQTRRQLLNKNRQFFVCNQCAAKATTTSRDNNEQSPEHEGK
jgi:hypothetical protein